MNFPPVTGMVAGVVGTASCVDVEAARAAIDTHIGIKKIDFTKFLYLKNAVMTYKMTAFGEKGKGPTRASNEFGIRTELWAKLGHQWITFTGRMYTKTVVSKTEGARQVYGLEFSMNKFLTGIQQPWHVVWCIPGMQCSRIAM